MTAPDTTTMATMTDGELESLRRELTDYKILYQRFRGRLSDLRDGCELVRRIAEDYDRGGLQSLADALLRAEGIICEGVDVRAGQGRDLEGRQVRARDRRRAQPREGLRAVVMARAACHGMDTERFFPDQEELGTVAHAEAVADAKAVCASCLVRRDCLRLALDGHEARGVWGGTTPRERASLLARTSAQEVGSGEEV